MYEESLRMPFLVSYPREIEPGSVSDEIVLNLDFAETFLDYAGKDAPEDMQGRSMRPLLKGETPEDWRQSMYYRYWMHLSDHGVYSHYGLRTKRYKLIYYYADALGVEGAIDEPKEPEWELFDLKNDPLEINSVYTDSDYAKIVEELRAELKRAKNQAEDFR